MKIKVRDFQSIAEADIEVEGLTIITGETNTGKSSLVRAVDALLKNRQGNDFIRKGAESCSVQVDNNRHRVIWTKGSKARYEVDGETIEKPGRGQAPPKVKSLGIQPIQAGGDRHYAQIGKQKSLPFIIGEASPAVTAELISSNQWTQQLTQAVRNGRREQGEWDAKVRVLQGQREDLSDRCRVVATFERDVSEGLEKLREKQQHVDSLKLDSQWYLKLFEKWRRHTGVWEALKQNPKRWPVKELKVRSDLPALKGLLRRWEKSSLWEDVTIPTEPETVDAGSLTQLRDVYASWQRKANPVEIEDFTGVELGEGKLAQMQKVYRRFRQTKQHDEEHLQEEKEIERQIVEVESLLEDKLQEQGVCPLCGKEM